MQSYRSLWVWVWIVLLALAYSLPWLSHISTVFTINAYDLAEWNSVLATSQQQTLPLIISGLLRMQLLIISVVAAYYAAQSPYKLVTIIGTLIAVALTIAQLPPLSAISNFLTNNNNAQQIALAALSAIFITAITIKRSWPWGKVIMVLHIIGIIAAIAGVAGSLNALQTVDIYAKVGIGAIVVIGLYTVHLIAMGMTPRQQTEGG
jgi:hypothetical protein